MNGYTMTIQKDGAEIIFKSDVKAGSVLYAMQYFNQKLGELLPDQTTIKDGLIYTPEGA